MKRCSKCGETKPLDEFHWDRSSPDSRRASCKICGRAASVAWYEANRERAKASNKAWKGANPRQVMSGHRRRVYGISPQDYDSMLCGQSGRCQICGEPMASPHVDHHHDSGKVRALLCQHCNHLLGHARDNPQTLLNAVQYLRTHHPEKEGG